MVRVRSRASVRLVPAVALLAFALPLGARTSQPASAATQSVAAATPRAPLLAVPHALLHRPAVPVIVEMKSVAPGVTGPLAAAASRGPLLSALHALKAHHVYAFHTIAAVAATVPGAALTTLLKEPGVRAIVPDAWVTPSPLPAAAEQSALDAAAAAGAAAGAGQRVIQAPVTIEPQSFSLTGAQRANAAGYNGAGVRVAIIDSGIDTSLPDLAGTMATDAQGRPLAVDFTGTDLTDTIGHGTACASMIAAQGRVLYTGTNRPLLQVYPQPAKNPPLYRSHFHVYGMAPDVRLMSAKIFDTRTPHDGGYESWIVRAIEWAVDHHANVISESFGGLEFPSNGTDPIDQADEAAIAAGITVVAADGNEGPGQTTISSPANAPGVIAVGASTQYRHFGQIGFLAHFGKTTADNIASFTSRGPTSDGRPRPDLVAPGAFSWALFPNYKTEDGPTSKPYDVGTFGGTSEATPVTAGAAALVIDAFRKAHHGTGPSPALVRAILMSSAHDLGYPAFDQGAGRLDAWKAVQTAVHSGPSFLLNPGSAAVSGPVAAPFTTTFSITNTGNTVQTYTVDAEHSHLTGFQTWRGTLGGTQLNVFPFTVRPGLERIVGSVYWNSADRYVVPGTNGEVAMRVALYDPLGRFANYSYGVGSGYASTEVAHPMPGRWTLVISENGRKDSAGVRRYTRESYRARLSTYVTVPYGTASPRAVTLAPGHAAPVVLSARTPAQAGVDVVTVHVHGDHTAALPIAVTSYITIGGSSATFHGSLTGASTDYFSLSNENKVYSINVPPATHALNVFLSWPDPGYGVVLLLMDPSGEIVDGQFNGIGNGNPNGPFDLSAHNLEMIWSNPVAGRWQIVVMDAIFSGEQAAEPFTGKVTLNDTPVTPLAVTRTVLPGSSFTVDLRVSNHNGPNVAEGYIGYATSSDYSRIPLGNISGPFGNPSKLAGSDVYTYTTQFVPPGTRLVSSSVAVVNPDVTADLAFADPIGFTRAEGQSMPVTIAGHHYAGTTAVVTGGELPIGGWFAEVTLRRPFNSHTHATIVATSYADALTPVKWISFDHGLANGRITGGQPLILLPGQAGLLHASVTVPLSMKPGTYHAHLFVISVFADQVADIPFTLVVKPTIGTEPGQ